MSTAEPMTATAVQVAQQLPADLAILKMENETIQSLAAARPRDHESIKRNLIQQIETYPSFAKSAIYSKPVGKDEGGKQKFARGLSVRAAEALAEAYGYCRVRTDVTPIDDDTVKVEATFTDYQQGRIWQDGGIVSKWYKDRYGKMQKIPDDRFFNVVVKAEASKRVREVIIRSVPPGLRAELFETCERKLDEVLDEKAVKAIIAKFATKGVTLAMIEEKLGRTVGMGWTADDRVTLLGIWNAIEEGETTVAEAFDVQPPKAEQQKPGNGGGSGISGADLTKKKEAAPEPASEQASESASPGAVERYQIMAGECQTADDIDRGLGLVNKDQTLTQEQRDEINIIFAAAKKKLGRKKAGEQGTLPGA